MEQAIQAREELWNSVAGLSDEQLNRRVKAGSWTIMQVLLHLHLMEENITDKVVKALAKEGNHPAEAKPIQITLDRSRRIESPGYLKPPEDFVGLSAIRERMDRSREAMLEAVKDVPEETLASKSYPHPVFGLMDARQWLEFAGLHEMRHRDQIEELKQGL